MRRNEIIAMVVSLAITFTIIGLIIAGIVGIFTNIFKEKEMISAEQFYSFMSEKRYEVKEIDNEALEYYNPFEAYIASNKEDDYEICFYEFSNDNKAEKFYRDVKNKMYDMTQSANLRINVSMPTYDKFTIQSKGDYYIVSRIKNTVLVVKGDEQFKEAIDKILSEIDY